MLTDAATRPTRERHAWARTTLAPSILFLTAMAVGAGVGIAQPTVASRLEGWVDPLILVLLTLLFAEVRLDAFRQIRGAPRLAGLVLAVNFLVAPLVAFGLSSIVVADDAVRVGVLIYCLFPCTDWFLGFTRTAGGDTTTGAATIPVSLLLQVALFPIYVGTLSATTIDSTLASAGGTIVTWFVVPAAIALGFRLLLRVTMTSAQRATVLSTTARLIPPVIAAMIVALFAANVGVLTENAGLIVVVLLVVAGFFVVMTLIGESTARLLRLPRPERALLLVSTSARNAPLMLALTAATMPGQPIVPAVIVVGMLLEFPHLTVLTAYLRRRGASHTEAPS